MPVKDPHGGCFFCPSIFFFLSSALLFIGRGNVWCGETWSLVDVALKVVFLPGSPEVHQCTWVLVWGESEPWTGTMRAGVGRAGVGIKRRENMIHGRVGPSRETAADLQSEGHWTGTKALFRQKECSMSCDGWRRSVREPLSRCVSGSHLQANTLNRDQMADARGPSGTCALRHTNDYGCRPINGHICKGEQQPAHWEWVSSFPSPPEWRHAGVRSGIKTQVEMRLFLQVQVQTRYGLHPTWWSAGPLLKNVRRLNSRLNLKSKTYMLWDLRQKKLIDIKIKSLKWKNKKELPLAKYKII